jgi:hypothetical protein
VLLGVRASAYEMAMKLATELKCGHDDTYISEFLMQ